MTVLLHAIEPDLRLMRNNRVVMGPIISKHLQGVLSLPNLVAAADVVSDVQLQHALKYLMGLHNATMASSAVSLAKYAGFVKVRMKAVSGLLSIGLSSGLKGFT